MSRRVALRSAGLRVSAAGFDAETATDDGHAITFDSSWTDIAKISAVGIAAESVIANTGGTDIWGIRAFYPNLGYKPFIEIRSLVGSLVRDDLFVDPFFFGGQGIIEATQTTIAAGSGPTNLGMTALFVVYQIPVPSQ